MSSRTLAVVPVFLLLFLVAPPPVLSCSCKTTPSVEEAFNFSTVVFLGKVVGGGLEGAPGYEYYRIDFLVEGVWKGPVTREFSIATPPDEGICGITFEIGGEYLVYAGDKIWEYDTDLPMAGLCGRTKTSQYAEADLNELGPFTPLPVVALTWGLLKSRFASPDLVTN